MRRSHLSSLPNIRLILISGLAIVGSIGAEAEPRVGQTLAEFEKAAAAELAKHDDKMGFGATLCPLSPPFVPNGQTFLSRSFSQTSATLIVLIAVKEGKVERWQEYNLPRLYGWLTHLTRHCRGSVLTFEPGQYAQRYRWNGREFKRLKGGPTS